MIVNCHTCNKIFEKIKNLKANRHFCSSKCFHEKRCEKKEICNICNRKIIDVHRMSNNFCNKCYRKDYRKRKPDQYEKLRKWSLERTRKKLGWDLNLSSTRKPPQKRKNNHGYVIIYMPEHPNSHGCGVVQEHVLIISEHLGRPLMKGETVHHKNGIRDDNRIENLELWNRSQPSGQRVEDRIKFYKEFLEEYGYKVDKI